LDVVTIGADFNIDMGASQLLPAWLLTGILAWAAKCLLLPVGEQNIPSKIHVFLYKGYLAAGN
jgi:hypothetical protein